MFVNNIVRALADAPGCSAVTLFSMGGGTAYDVPGQVDVAVSTNPALRLLQEDKALSEAVSHNPIDVLLCPGTQISTVSGVPTVMWPLSVAPFEHAALARLGSSPKQRARWYLLRQATARATSRASGLVFSSFYAQALYRDHITAARSLPSKVIPPAASLAANASDLPLPALPERYVLLVSHLYPYKMVLETIEGFARARAQGVGHHLVIAGAATFPSYGERIRKLIRRSGLTDSIHLLGDVGPMHLPALYRRADLFVFPSISENAGSYALIDAFTFGCPVLSSSASSMPEACQDAARYFDPRAPAQLETELVRVLMDEGIRADLAARSTERGLALRDWDDIGRSAIEFLTHVSDGCR